VLCEELPASRELPNMDDTAYVLPAPPATVIIVGRVNAVADKNMYDANMRNSKILANEDTVNDEVRHRTFAFFL
jgi:hypothetical protein